MKLWIWRAWTRRRRRLTDAGWCAARSAEAARRVAAMLHGGPHRTEVIELEVEEIAFRY